MEKFLELLNSLDIDYEIQDGAVIVKEELDIEELDVKHISIPENTNFKFGLICNESNVEIQLPENLKVAYILYLGETNLTHLPSNLTVYDSCSVYLDVEKIENVAYCENCGGIGRTIFAFWANDDFLIAAGCFTGTYSEFAAAVDKKYGSHTASEYKQQARDCISELAEKLGKPDPFKKATAN
ncbi:hypothetical protein [Gilliamella apicola]|uniref:hypothetical protein n=1 Tax=Gilliamella apicola TaxID=1196095 RepID=UPI000A355669|nr:hypothetical protein [Gilliamella apicola]OTP93793.1 hypothetical protein B6D13_09310 [Gilliamella apicola]OTQ00760.1 hypothetical protein B6D07_10010 [Gilliamella apicola]OTQ31722.1 hypothetical protein B6D02_03680 [Gilliamella apicola]